MSLNNLPSPPRIPVSGADDCDIENTVAHIELLTQLYKSAVLENTAKYRDAVLLALANHNENVPITRTTRPKSFTYGLEAISMNSFARPAISTTMSSATCRSHWTIGHDHDL